MAKRTSSPVPPSSHEDQHVRKYTRSPSPRGPVLPSLAAPPTHACPSPDCVAIFPSAHLLDLHLAELHDPLVAARQARGEKTFRCFEPACDKVTRDPAKRRRHLIDKHGYPRDFEFRVVVGGTRGLKSWLRHGPGGAARAANGRGRGRGRGREMGGGMSNDHTGRGGSLSGRGQGRGGGRGGTLTLPMRAARKESSPDKRNGQGTQESTGRQKHAGTSTGAKAKAKGQGGHDKAVSSSDAKDGDTGSDAKSDDDNNSDNDSDDSDDSDDDSDEDHDSNASDDSDADDSDEDSDEKDEEEDAKEAQKVKAKPRPKSPDIDALATSLATTLRFVPRSVVGRRPLQEKEKENAKVKAKK